ncbi:MAG: cation diffusion facilitator family transporter [Pirellulales bacterium]|nr:cation diffusion facilitator family transporter [Pirellulales bacterium]
MSGHHSHNHSHTMTPDSLDRAMMIGVSLNLIFVLVEFGFGFFSGSLALLADAGHNASDVVGLLLAWGASFLARRQPSQKFTFGLRRATIYAAFLNAVLLLAACAVILWEAICRLSDPAPVAGFTMIAVAAIGVVINTVTAILFMRGSKEDANVRGAFLHMAADAAVSVGVVFAGVAIMATGIGWIDPVVSIIIVVVIIWGTWDLFTESVGLAMDAVPRRININELTNALAEVPGVLEIHDLHVWGMSTSEVMLTAHLVIAESSRQGALKEAQSVLRDRFAITHTTLQFEDSSTSQAGAKQPGDRV